VDSRAFSWTSSGPGLGSVNEYCRKSLISFTSHCGHGIDACAKLTKYDAAAIAKYLKSLPPLKNKVPGPFGPNDKPTVFIMKLVPPEGATQPKRD